MYGRKFKQDRKAAIYYIQMGIVILIMSALAVPIVFSVIGAMNPKTVDSMLQTALGKSTAFTPAANATVNILNISGTVLSLNPLAALVSVAAGMIALLAGAFLAPGRTGI